MKKYYTEVLKSWCLGLEKTGKIMRTDGDKLCLRGKIIGFTAKEGIKYLIYIKKFRSKIMKEIYDYCLYDLLVDYVLRKKSDIRYFIRNLYGGKSNEYKNIFCD